MFAKVDEELRDEHFAGKTENAFLALNFPCVRAGSLVVRESRDQRDRISDKNIRKQWSEFFEQKPNRTAVFIGNLEH